MLLLTPGQGMDADSTPALFSELKLKLNQPKPVSNKDYHRTKAVSN
jgi:hypothetical protein